MLWCAEDKMLDIHGFNTGLKLGRKVLSNNTPYYNEQQMGKIPIPVYTGHPQQAAITDNDPL